MEIHVGDLKTTLILQKERLLLILFSKHALKSSVPKSSSYLEKMWNILSDSSKFTQVSVAEDKQLNFTVNVEKHNTDLLKDLQNSEVISGPI